MSIERVYYCDGPDCGDQHTGGLPTHAKTKHPPPHLPFGMLEVRELDEVGETVHHFCTWNCALKFAAKIEPPTIIPFEDTPFGGPA